ncbi:MAG: hypothetical protein ACRD3C_09510 [Vicinamibacterales bacterium]
MAPLGAQAVAPDTADRTGPAKGISPRQIDRRLQPDKRDLRRRLYGRTKPGTLLTTPDLRLLHALVSHEGGRFRLAPEKLTA